MTVFKKIKFNSKSLFFNFVFLFFLFILILFINQKKIFAANCCPNNRDCEIGECKQCGGKNDDRCKSEVICADTICGGCNVHITRRFCNTYQPPPDPTNTPTPTLPPLLKNPVVVCPSGTAGQNGCDYIGGDGIQEAVDRAPVGSSTNKTRIIIKPGVYTRQNYTEYLTYDLQKNKCFVNTKEKFLVFEGENQPILDGENSSRMSGFCGKGGEIEVKGLIIKGFKKDDDSCFSQNSSPCSRGRGLQLEGNIKATVTNNQITGNQNLGISTHNNSQSTITNNLITRNQSSGIYLRDSSQATITNNTISFNKSAGIDTYQSSDHNPSVVVKNNIITNNFKNTDNSFGFGIGGRGLHEAGKLNNDHFSYNLIWGNEGENTSCGNLELCENFTGRVNLDPRFVNPSAGDFHLKPGSPAIDAGDPQIKDPDGSRSDLGAYGGPGACGIDPELRGCCQPPSPPQNLTFTINGNQITYSWNAVSNATSYPIRVNDLTNGWDQDCSNSNPGDVCNDNYTQTSYTFTMERGHVYNFWVHAKNDCDQSEAVGLPSAYRRKHYSALIIAEKPLVVDYSYNDGNQVASFLNKGHSIESADKKIFLPRVLKGAYKKNNDDPGFNSGIVLMNTQNEVANITLKIYKKDGSRLLKKHNSTEDAIYTFTLQPYGFKGIWPPNFTDWPTEEIDSPAIIESDRKIVVDVDLRHDTLDPKTTINIDGSMRGSAYEGIPEKKTSKKWYLPILLRNAHGEGWESGIIIQNTERNQANLEISLYGIDNNYQKNCQVNLPPMAQKIIYLPNSSLNDCFPELINNENYNNNKKFAGKIVSDKNIAVVFSHSSSLKRKSIEENAIPEELTGKTIFIPRAYNNYYNWISSFTIQNISPNQNNQIEISFFKKNGAPEPVTGSCLQNQVNPLKSLTIFVPNCIPEGNNLYSAIIKSNNNLGIAGIYHIAYPKTTPNPENLAVYRSAGSTGFSEKEVSRVFFIPRAYFYSWNWQTGIQIQNTVNETNNFNLYILSENGKILTRKWGSSAAYETKHFYLPTDFASELAIEPQEGDYPDLQNIPITPACQKKTQGDANCDGEINEVDYDIWECEFLGDGECNNLNTNLSASFDLDSKVDLIDFEIWRQNQSGSQPTNTPSPSPSPNPNPTATPSLTPTHTPTPSPTPSPTPTETPTPGPVTVPPP